MNISKRNNGGRLTVSDNRHPPSSPSAVFAFFLPFSKALTARQSLQETTSTTRCFRCYLKGMPSIRRFPIVHKRMNKFSRLFCKHCRSSIRSQPRSYFRSILNFSFHTARRRRRRRRTKTAARAHNKASPDARGSISRNEWQYRTTEGMMRKIKEQAKTNEVERRGGSRFGGRPVSVYVFFGLPPNLRECSLD